MRIPASCGLSGHGISVTGGLCVDVPGRRAVIGTAAPGQRPPMLPGPPDNREQAAGGTRRSAVRGYGAGGVVSTTGGPVDTTIVTALPGGAVDPPAGLCNIAARGRRVHGDGRAGRGPDGAFGRCDLAEPGRRVDGSTRQRGDDRGVDRAAGGGDDTPGAVAAPGGTPRPVGCLSSGVRRIG